MFITLEQTGWLTIALLVADWVIRLGFSVRIIMRGRPVGVSLAWLSIVLVFPFVGAIILSVSAESSPWSPPCRVGRDLMPYQAWLDGLRDALHA